MQTIRNDRGTMRRRVSTGIALLVAALTLMAGGVAPVGASDNGAKKESLREFCEDSWGIWYERSDGSYGCMVNGLESECDANGNCTTVCHERWGCPCDEIPVPCKRAGKPGTSTGPLDDVVQIDPYQEAKLPEESSPEPSSPVSVPEGVVIEDDQVMQPIDPVTDPAPVVEPDPAPTVIEDAPTAPILTTR